MLPIDLKTAAKIIDFQGKPGDIPADLAALQLEGAVALHNMLADSDIGLGYLADEVGMGKTYVALGTVALMRYFNPGLRVLYICPSRNVQEKWCAREHPNFIRKNVVSKNFNIRTPQGEPGTPAISCTNIEELINAATTGYYGDIFVRMSSFSLAMGTEEHQLEANFKWLQERVPDSVTGAAELDFGNKSGEDLYAAKVELKRVYARAINYLLPTFDLVMIDEAHNFKHDFYSSARNTALSRILGFYREDDGDDDYNYRLRVKNALLLSATPFAIDPRQLYNQLNLVGKPELLGDSEHWSERDYLKNKMQRFMVRRLNNLTIQGKPHTRNMYRREWRKGDRAEIGFETDEHKLVTALVQKHIGDLLGKDKGNPAFQMGMLASFESYAQTAKSEPVQFDGEKADKGETDARDRHVITFIRDSYVDMNLGQSLPHPKMDQVSCEVAEHALNNARKQLVFVRRVKSVDEFKQKLDDIYNGWLAKHIRRVLRQGSPQAAFMDRVLESYRLNSKQRDQDTAGINAQVLSEDGEEILTAKNDTLFSWFFRGAEALEMQSSLKKNDGRWITPSAMRKSLTAKRNTVVLLFEFNWADWYVREVLGETMESQLGALDEDELAAMLRREGRISSGDTVSEYITHQRAFLKIIQIKRADDVVLRALLDYLGDIVARDNKDGVILEDEQAAFDSLRLKNFFTHLRERKLDAELFDSARSLAEELKNDVEPQLLRDAIHRVEIHRQVVAQSLRTGHGMIDLYLTRLNLGSGDLSTERQQSWLKGLCDALEVQLKNGDFSTAEELGRLSGNLDLVIKNNLPGVHAVKPRELRQWLAYTLPSSAPMIGANGETTDNRSSQARKFRMPGYPLVLVSTDVFQEGEDLHTFCDSVVHYGLSSSPVSIEQKTGRVDRVGAFAHRRLVKRMEDDSINDDEYVQVSFPFVKQSIEAIQVRALCRNLNDFIRSLHEVGTDGAKTTESLNADEELADRGEIPGQIMDLLSSPYDLKVSAESTPELTQTSELTKQVADDNIRFSAAVEHVWSVVVSVAGGPITREKIVGMNLAGLKHADFSVHVNSARSCGEMLLRAQDDCFQEIHPYQYWSATALCERQAQLYDETFSRTFAIRENNGIALYRDAEMLVGGTEITCADDIRGLFHRFAPKDKLGVYKVPPNAAPFNATQADVNEYIDRCFQWQGSYSSVRHPDHIELVFHFNRDAERKHHILLREVHGYCLFEAVVADAATVKNLSAEKLMQLTWLRNRNIDLAEFLVRPDRCIAGRTVHPVSSLGFEEFVFNAFILAVEADRLEYLLKVSDEY